MKRLLPWLLLLLLAVPLVFLLFDRPDDARVADVSRESPPPQRDSRPPPAAAPTMPPMAGDAASTDAAPAGAADGLPEPMKREIDAVTRRDSAGLVEEVMPDGSVRVRLQQRFRQAPVAVIDKSGELHITEY